MWVHGHMLKVPGVLGSNLSWPVFDFWNLGSLSPLPCQVFHLSLVEEAGGEG